MEPNYYDSSNRQLNFSSISNQPIQTSNTRPTNVIPVSLYLATEYIGSDNYDQTYQRNYSNQQNNIGQAQPNNGAQIYIPAVCLVPVRLYNANNILPFTENNASSNTQIHTEYSELTPTLQQHDYFSLENAQNFANSTLAESSTNLLYNQDFDDVSLMQILQSVSTDPDMSSSYFSQSLPLTDSSSSGQDTSGSLDKSVVLSSSSFEELTTFPIMDAPVDCVWHRNNAVINQSPSDVSANLPSLDELHTPLMNKEITTAQATLQTCSSQTCSEGLRFLNNNEYYPNQNDLPQPIEANPIVEEDAFPSYTHNTNNPSWNTGAVPKILNEEANYAFAVQNAGQFVTPSYCKLCFKNQEPEFVYNSHQLKSENGIVTCPVLRNYVCPICRISGDYAHTISYCPLNPQNRRYNRVHLGEKKNEHNTEQLHSFPSMSSTQFSPYFENTEAQPITSQTTETVQYFDVNVANTSYNFSSTPYNTNRSTRSAMTYNRSGCAFPGAHISKRKKRVCKFCFRNKAQNCAYNNHELRDETGNIICPVLRKFVCRICGASGDNAHTRKYCPQNTYEDFIQLMGSQ